MTQQRLLLEEATAAYLAHVHFDPGYPRDQVLGVRVSCWIFAHPTRVTTEPDQVTCPRCRQAIGVPVNHVE